MNADGTVTREEESEIAKLEKRLGARVDLIPSRASRESASEA
jgi:hypothetical protein